MAILICGAMRGALRARATTPAPAPAIPVPCQGQPAAREGDVIQHKSFFAALAGAVVGALVAAGIGALCAVAIGVTGGLAVAAVTVVSGFLFSDVIGAVSSKVTSMCESCSSPDGAIIKGSSNVFIEKKPAARAMVDIVTCGKHGPVPPIIAQGSETVFVNGSPLARYGDKVTCGATIKSGAKTVFAGSGQGTYLEVAEEFSLLERAILIGVEFLVPPSMGLAKGLGRLLVKGFTKGLARGALIGALKAGGKKLLSKASALPKIGKKLLKMPKNLNCARGAFKGSKGVNRFTEGAKKLYHGDPIDVTTGSVVEQRVDFVIGNTFPFAFKRTYQTGYAHTGALGYRWADSLSECLISHADDRYEIRLDEGESLWFALPDKMESSYNPEHPNYVLARAKEGYVLYCRDSLSRKFFLHKHQCVVDAQTHFPLSEWRDVHENNLTFFYDQSHLPYAIAHSDGQQLRLHYDGALLTRIDRVDGQTVTLARYRQDRFGYLVEADATDAYQIWYQYDHQGWMTRWEDRQSTWVSYVYDAEGRCIKSCGADGYYDVELRYEDGLTYAYDSQRRLTRYHHDDQLVTAIENEHGTTRFSYDLFGNLTQQTTPLGHQHQWAYLRDSGLVSHYTDPIGRVWQYAYDDHDYLTGITDPLGQTVTAKRNARGQVVGFVTADGRVQQAEYNRQGLLTRLTDETTATEQVFDYDNKHRLFSIFDECHRSTQFRYDQLDRLQSLSQADGAQWRLQRENNRRLRLIQPNGSSVNAVFDRQHNLTHYTDALGVLWQVDYGAFDLPVSRTDGAGQIWRYIYEPDRLQLASVTNPSGETYRYIYDASGRVVAEQDYAGVTTRYQYDADGRCVAVKVADATLVTLAYDAAGQLLTRTVQQGQSTSVETRFHYDALGRWVAITRADDSLVRQFDIRGRQVDETYTTAYIQQGWVCTFADEQTEQRTYWWRDAKGETQSHTLMFYRNHAGELTGCQLPAQDWVKLTRDKGGRLAAFEHPDGLTIQQNWLPGGGLATQQVNQWQRHYQYDANSVLTAANDEGVETRYVVNGNRQVTQVQHNANLKPVSNPTSPYQNPFTEQWHYDPSGYVTEPNRRSFNRGHHLAQFGNQQWRYDSQGRVVQRIEQSAGFRPRCWQYHWNGDNQLTRLINPDGKQWFYQYDPLGRRVMKWHSSHQQQKTHYLWFGDQLVGIRDECNEEHTHTRYWHYDGWDLLAQQFIESDDETLQKVRTDWAVSDPTALPLRFYNQTGQLTWQSPKRTLWGKAYLANDELGLNELRFAGQQYDAESGLCYNRFRYYHPDSGCYLSPDPLGLMGGLNTHAYVPNPTGWVDPLGLASCRKEFLGRTPGKTSKTGREVIERMRSEGRIRGSGDRMQFKSSTDGKWYRVNDADMAHTTDAVKYWNQRGGFYGAKSREVRAWMRDSNNYELEYFSHNRSQGALLPDRYKPATDFIGPAERSQYF